MPRPPTNEASFAFVSEETPEPGRQSGAGTSHIPAEITYTADSSLLDAAVAGGRGNFCTTKYVYAACGFFVLFVGLLVWEGCWDEWFHHGS
eukprot:COSAG05_NODE_12187_length_479_cov_0.907895_1_plen_90_part_01